MLGFHMHAQSSTGNSVEKHPYVDSQTVLPLDDADITFFKQLTGIYNNEEFETHLLSIQAEAYEVTRFFLVYLALI
jgi:hypothetical protein